MIDIGTARFSPVVFFKKFIPAMQPPPFDHLKIGAQLDSISSSLKIILEEQRKPENGGGGAKTYNPPLPLVIVKNLDLAKHLLTKPGAVAQFVGQHCFRL